jgi:glycosyltransferase involved in cell wall biosynthesis/cyclopropane fatty-acyl-phospholipid synthase-like methyltransferase
MPTANRRAFVPHAIRYFLNQDYPNRELIVMDDGADPIGDLIPGDPRIRYFRLEGTRSLGVKRNLACEQARGEVILHWDDDDWMASWRISYQVHHLMEADADICGIARMYFFAPHREQAWLYVFPEEARPWVGGGSLCYTKAIWREDPFRDVTIGEDNQFLQGEHPKRVAVLEDPRFYVALVHPENTSPKVTEDSRWQPRPAMEMRQILGADWSVYWPDAVPPGRENREPEADGQQRPGSAMVVARKADLRLPEFRTFNHGQSLPRMRQWELPFALFAARLEPAMTVLDCTINPVNFGERLNHLYPHVLYRHVNVFAGGTFCFPWGIPDNAFDRIFCINTLEHLPPALRQPTIEELSRKLKVGGRMILISDHSFDSQGNGPECASFEEWTRMCRASGLRPATRGRAPALPTAGDAWSYKNLPPYSHGTVAGVFAKGKQRAPRPRRVVLGLLTWNTREVSLESVHAYVQEAHMLRRLGVDAAICVCDNGSTDGTQDALRALDGETTEEHAFLLNGHNRGNSIARNQIIDYALQWNADYVLLMDGDIEVVPFSSFAMMRYLDDAGHRVGCIGPDSAGYTGTREDAAPCLYSLAGSRVETTERVAWTQYGMFRCAMFREGIRFDESGPFAGPGWGCEDDDLIYQIISRSYLCQRFFGMTYLHRAMHSSVRHLQDSGADVSELFEQRRQYVIAKWSSVPRINHGPLEALRGVRINFAPRPALEPRWRRVLSGVRQELKNIYGEDHHYTKDYSRCEEGFWAHIPGWLEEAGRRSKPSLVLDIGAAYGTLAALCTQLFNCRAHCTDVVPFMSADVARIHDLTIHFPLNVETSPLPKGSFDIVLLTETLEHFNYHPLPTLRKIRKALAKDGRLFLTTPDAATWGRAAQYYASLAEIPKPPKRRPESWIDDHIWQYTRDELMEVIGKAGFVVEREAMSSNGIATHFNLELRAAVSGNTRSSA